MTNRTVAIVLRGTLTASLAVSAMAADAPRRPNILFIMSDDHSHNAISAYGSRINRTPNIDRIAREGMRFDRCLVTNSICTPSRGCIMTGQYSHVNGVTTLDTMLDNSRPNVAKHLQAAGYQTAMVGKWHLGNGPKNCPTGFDWWCVLPGQGAYDDPMMIEMGEKQKNSGYVTDIITDKALGWLNKRDPAKPFFLMLHHKAPHRSWQPAERHAKLYDDVEIPYPPSFDDDYATRPAAAAAKMRMEDLTIKTDLKGMAPPAGLSAADERRWRYQHYIKDYLRCVAAVDENVGRVLDWLDKEKLADDTLVIYTSDQGFYLGDHGWFDKRFIYEESLRMPFVVRYPRTIKPGSTCGEIVTNVDFAETFLDLAGQAKPVEMQGRSFLPLMQGTVPADWPQSMYYRYWMHDDGSHNVWAHYGVVTKTNKLVYFYNRGLGQLGAKPGNEPPHWEFFDTVRDPHELKNAYGDPANAATVQALKAELARLQQTLGDKPVAE